jgi:hypothetical protein
MQALRAASADAAHSARAEALMELVRCSRPACRCEARHCFALEREFFAVVAWDRAFTCRATITRDDDSRTFGRHLTVGSLVISGVGVRLGLPRDSDTHSPRRSTPPAADGSRRNRIIGKRRRTGNLGAVFVRAWGHFGSRAPRSDPPEACRYYAQQTRSRAIPSGAPAGVTAEVKTKAHTASVARILPLFIDASF